MPNGFTMEIHGGPWRRFFSAWPDHCTAGGMTTYRPDPVAGEIIGAAIEVHKQLGPGLLESAYQVCLGHEFLQRNVPFAREVPVPIVYKGIRLDCGYRLDFLVNGDIIVEVKSVDKLLPIHTAQVL